MYCPECGAEFRAGIERCADCDAVLVAEAPELHPEPEQQVTVFETSDALLIPLIKSVLDGASIPFTTQGEGLVNLFPAEALGTISGRHSGEVRIRVPEPFAEEARRLLASGVTAIDEEENDAS